MSVAERYRQLSSNQFSEGSIPSRHRGGGTGQGKNIKRRDLGNSLELGIRRKRRIKGR